jgi:hypothetical protein
MGRFVSLGFSFGETTVTSNKSPPFSFGSRFTFLRGLLEALFLDIQFTRLKSGRPRVITYFSEWLKSRRLCVSGKHHTKEWRTLFGTVCNPLAI